jgi:mono/diheme cytochrome c family protein
MPWQNYAQMSDEDLRAVYAYLRSIKAVRNQVPDAVLR